jgi:hypothetical protein
MSDPPVLFVHAANVDFAFTAHLNRTLQTTDNTDQDEN